MTTALVLLQDALQEIGVLDGQETPSDNDANRGLRVLNSLLDSWSLDNLTVYVQNTYIFTLTPGQFSYSIGPQGDFGAPRFTGIEDAFCTYQGIDFPIEIIDNQQYDSIAFKAQTGPIVQFLVFDATMPNSRVTLWPVPSSAVRLNLLTNQLFSTPVKLTTDLGFPPGYDRAFVKMLAIELCPSYSKEASQTLIALGRAAMRSIKRQNKRTPILQYDAAIPNGNRGWGDGSIAYGPGGVIPVATGNLALDGLTLALDGSILALV